MAKVESQIREYIGISGTTNEDGVSPNIMVFVPEFLPNCDKEDLTKTEPLPAAVKDPFTGVVGTSTITRSNAICCTYLGGENMSIPCIVTGERVRVLNIGGTEQYYWLPLGRDHGLRRHERQRWFVMNQPKSVDGGSYPDVQDTNTYFIEFNTNKGQKEFHIHTSFNDGEPYKYDIHIIPEQSTILITDNINNYIKLRSDEHWWKLHNTDGSYIEANKENITLWCKDTITMYAGKHIKTTSGQTTTNNAGQTHTTKAPDIIRNGSSSISDQAPKVNIKGDSGDCLIEQTSLNKHTHPYSVHSGVTQPPDP